MPPRFSHLVVTTEVRHRFQARIAAEQILDLLRHHGCPYPDNARLSVQGGHFVIEWDQMPAEKQAAVSYNIPLKPLSGEGMGEPEPADTSPPDPIGDLKRVREESLNKTGVCNRVRPEDIEQAEDRLRNAVDKQLGEQTSVSEGSEQQEPPEEFGPYDTGSPDD